MDWPQIFIPLFVVLAVLAAVSRFGRGYHILETWAEAGGYQILNFERRYLRLGPFFFGTSKGQVVYRVTVQDQQGQIRRGYVRCGSYLLGVWSDQAEVRWDDKPPHQPGFPVIMNGPDDRDKYDA